MSEYDFKPLMKLRCMEMLTYVLYLLEIITLKISGPNSLLIIPAIIASAAFVLSIETVNRKYILTGIKEKKTIIIAKLLGAMKSASIILCIIICIITELNFYISLILFIIFLLLSKVEKDYYYDKVKEMKIQKILTTIDEIIEKFGKEDNEEE